MITADNLDKETISALFESAIMEVEYDSDGDLRVRDDGYRTFVLLREKRIRLLTHFGAVDGIGKAAMHEFANKVNSEYIMIRVSVTDNELIAFDYDIMVDGGISERNLVLTTKRFLVVIRDAIAEYGGDVVA